MTKETFEKARCILDAKDDVEYLLEKFKEAKPASLQRAGTTEESTDLCLIREDKGEQTLWVRLTTNQVYVLIEAFEKELDRLNTEFCML